MAHAEVCVAFHHRQRRPSAQLFQHRQRRAALHVPARPGVAQIVEAQPRQARAFAGLAPGVVADLGGGRVGHLARLGVGMGLRLPARHREQPAAVLALLGAQHGQGGLVQRHRQVAPGLGLVAEDPRGGARHVHLLPAQQPHVAFAQAGGQREAGHGAQVRRQFGEQRARLRGREPGYALGGLVHLGDGRHGGQPVALVRVVQDLRELGQVAVHGGVAARRAGLVGGLGLALGGELADALVADAVERLALQPLRQPAQAQLDVFDAAAVAVVGQPGEDGGVPAYAGGFAEALGPPEIARKGRGVFLRRASFRGASAALNALAVDADVNPERASFAAGIDAHR